MQTAPEIAASRDDGMLRALRIVNDAESEELVLMYGKPGVYRTGPMAAKYRAVDMAEAAAHVRRGRWRRNPHRPGTQRALHQPPAGCCAPHRLRRPPDGSHATGNASN